MKIENVAKLSPQERLIYWIEERHKIHIRRRARRSKPWTDDEILQSYFFTNPYRENDKTTVWFRENIREPMKNDWNVVFATICFRWFNYIPTGQLLLDCDLFRSWDGKVANKILGAVPGKVFTGAYMISGKVYTGLKKTECVVKLLRPIWKDREALAIELEESRSMQTATKIIMKYRGLGGFMAYEVACDLRYTGILEYASDVATWCNPGPGCRRGLARINGWRIKSNNTPKLPENWLDQVRRLLDLCKTKLSYMPKFEMREVEHSLCEWDKYERLRLKEGQSKRRYIGV